MQENPSQLERIVNGFGWSLTADDVHLMYRSPVDLYVDQWVYELLDLVEETGARRVLIDSLSDLQHASNDNVAFREYTYSLTQRLARRGVSAFMTTESPSSSPPRTSPNSASPTSPTTSCCCNTNRASPQSTAPSPSKNTRQPPPRRRPPILDHPHRHHPHQHPPHGNRSRLDAQSAAAPGCAAPYGSRSRPSTHAGRTKDRSRRRDPLG